MMTCKTLANKLNEVNSTNDIKVVKEHGYYIIKLDGYESEFCYTLNEVASKMVYCNWTMSGLKTATIKGVC